MVTSISNSTASGALSLLRSANSGSSGLMDAIGGTASTDTSASALFNAICPGSTSNSIDSILNSGKTDTSKLNIFTNIASRLSAMQAGSYTASSDWEKVASYAMQTGQPVDISLNSKTGSPQATTQNESDLSQFNKQQQTKILQTIEDITTMTNKIQANQKNENMVKELAGAEGDLNAIAIGETTAQSDWERTGSSLMTIHHPFKISLDSSGNLMVQDQTTASLDKYSAAQQKILRAAIESVPDVISNGTNTKTWQADANAYAANNVPFYLDINPTTNEVVCKENSADNITPGWLKTDPYPDIGANTTALKQAASYIKAGKAYFLDVDSTGTVVAKEATAQNLYKYNNKSTTSTTSSSSSTSSAATILSVIA